MYSCHVSLLSNTQGSFVRFIVTSLMYSCHVSLLSNTQGSFVRLKVKTGLNKIVAHLTNNSLFKKRFFNRPIRFTGSNFDSGEINGNVIGSARSKDLTARRPLASRVMFTEFVFKLVSGSLFFFSCSRHQKHPEEAL